MVCGQPGVTLFEGCKKRGGGGGVGGGVGGGGGGETTMRFTAIETICLLLRDGNNGRSDLAGEA